MAVTFSDAFKRALMEGEVGDTFKVSLPEPVPDPNVTWAASSNGTLNGIYRVYNAGPNPMTWMLEDGRVIEIMPGTTVQLTPGEASGYIASDANVPSCDDDCPYCAEADDETDDDDYDWGDENPLETLIAGVEPQNTPFLNAVAKPQYDWSPYSMTVTVDRPMTAEEAQRAIAQQRAYQEKVDALAQQQIGILNAGKASGLIGGPAQPGILTGSIGGGQLLSPDELWEAFKGKLETPTRVMDMSAVKCPGHWEMQALPQRNHWRFTLQLWNETLSFELTEKALEGLSFNPDAVAGYLAERAELEIASWEARQEKRW